MRLSLSTIFAAAALLPGVAAGQATVYFSEDFNGAFPPAGWQTVNENGHSGIGWQYDGANLRAWHADELLQTDDSLETINNAVDLTGATGNVYLHFANDLQYAQYLANHPNSLGNGVSNVDVSTNAGATWTTVWTETRQNDGLESTVIDLSGYAGQRIDIRFWFSGDFAQEWWVDDVRIDDDPNPPPPPPTTWNIPNLPTSFVSLPYDEDFDALGGIAPPHMALNAMDPNFNAGYADAWCDINGSNFTPNSGTAALEMGGNPSSSSGIEVRNAMVLAIDGDGFEDVAFQAFLVDHGEEDDNFDGVWVSEDGVGWYGVYANGDWGGFIGGTATWESHGAPLHDTPVDTSGRFYLMFAQDDNFPYAGADGIGVDDLSVNGTVTAPRLNITNLVAGGLASIETTRMDPGSDVMFVFSTTGPGPVNTPFGPLECSPPLTTTPLFPVDGAGGFSFDAAVPPSMAGMTLWAQAVEFYAGGGGELSEALQQPVQ